MGELPRNGRDLDSDCLNTLSAKNLTSLDDQNHERLTSQFEYTPYCLSRTPTVLSTPEL